MVDPISAAGTSLARAATAVLTKRLQSKAGLRLGSRDERRQVYARFQASVTEMHSVANFVRLEARLDTVIPLGRLERRLVLPGTVARTREYVSALRAAQSELLQAYFELRLVANPAPLKAAHLVLERVGEMGGRLGGSDAVADRAILGIVEAQREFTDVCRDDLWYLPKRWQIYRLEWWSARRWRRHPAT